MYRTIVEESNRNISIMDIFSKLIQNRIIFIDGIITDELANAVIAQMLYLDSVSKDEITIYINSAGGSVYDGLAVYDVGRRIKSPIKTVCIGKGFSMGAILMLMGEIRCATKNSTLMLHEPSSELEGKATDIKISHEELQRVTILLQNIITERTKIEDIEESFKFDVWFSAEEALECGILTEILD